MCNGNGLWVICKVDMMSCKRNERVWSGERKKKEMRKEGAKSDKSERVRG